MPGLTKFTIYSSQSTLNLGNRLKHACVYISVLVTCLFSLQGHSQTPSDPQAESTIAESLITDQTINKQQRREDLDQWLLAAYEGDPEAQYKVGKLYSDPKFNKLDHKQAVYWYRQAARLGHVLAQYNLGHQYLLGIGVNKSESSAMKWWLEAAKQGHNLAQFNIGRAYYLGIGLEQDHKKSKYWFTQAADSGEPKSIEILGKLGWSNDEVDPAVVAEYKKDSDSAATQDQTQSITKNNQIGESKKIEAIALKQETKKPNPTSQLAIKEARDRRASPNLTSKIIPIDLSKEAAAAPMESSNTTDTQNDIDESTAKNTKVVEKNETRTLPEKRINSLENTHRESTEKEHTEVESSEVVSAEPIKSTELKKSKLILVENNGRLGNLKPDEQLAVKQPLNKIVTGSVASKTNKPTPTQEAKLDSIKANQSEESRKPMVKVAASNPVAIYTNPEKRSVLIAIIDDRSELKIVNSDKQWSRVTSTKGIPVWMHGDFLKLDTKFISDRIVDENETVQGTVSGSNVNTRSVPIVSPGTVVGRVNEGERLVVMEKREQWYRVIAPTRFTAWVKTEDLKDEPPIVSNKVSNKLSNKIDTKVKPTAVKNLATTDSTSSDIKWLFNQKKNDLTLQLGNFSEDDQRQNFLQQIDFQLNREFHQLEFKNGKLNRTVFLYGAYQNRKSAEMARSKINQAQAWVRPFSGLQENLCKQWQEESSYSVNLKRYCK